jgi:hypothetical protein
MTFRSPLVRAGKIPSIFAAAIGLSVLLTGQAQDSGSLRRLVIGRLPADGVTSAPSGRSWRLGRLNQTSSISAAYLYNDHVVVFGWIGCCGGTTTIIDSTSGQERLEFLDYDSHITPTGLLVFRRFYPHFSDPSVISDAIEELDLNLPIPRKIPTRANENPTDQIGAAIYPQGVTPNVRHEIGHNFVITDTGRLLFLADRLSSGKLCLVRLSLSPSADQVRKDNCLTAGDFNAASLSALHIRKISENAFGDLILSADVGEPNASTRRDFDIDKISLQITPVKPIEAPEHGSLSIPWSVQRKAIMQFVPLSGEFQANGSVKVRLDIDSKGRVADVVVSGPPADLAALVKRAVLQWEFEPTLLDGHQVRVVTEFSTEVNRLGKIPE